MSNLTRLQMRGKMFVLFGESAGHITTAMADEWLQEGYTEFSSLSKSLVVYERFPVVEGVVTLPPGFNELIYIDTGAAVFFTEYEMFTGTIVLRAIEGQEIPGEIFMKYWASPSTATGAAFQQLTTDTSVTALSETGDKSLWYYALSRAYKADNRPSDALDAYKEFAAGAAIEFERTVKLRAKPLIKTSAWTGRVKMTF